MCQLLSNFAFNFNLRRYTVAPLVYLGQWLDAQGAADKKWKLDKNIQNWLLYNVFDEEQVGPGVILTVY
jgi:hypothetical protein